MIEEWRTIEGYEGLYEVSNLGRVRSLDMYVKGRYGNYRLHKGKVLSPAKDKNGYLKVNLCYNGKDKIIRVHRLVAGAFVSNPDNLPEVNHKDEDKTNNNVENLEWCNRKDNINYGTRTERQKNTNIQNGFWTGLSKEEYKKKYYQNHKKEYNERKREYYRKKKEQNIQNNVKSLDD